MLNATRSLSDALAAHTGHGRAWTFRRLSEATGIPLRRLYYLRDGTREAHWPEILCLIDTLGPSFANKLLEPVRITGAFRAGANAEPFEFPALAAKYGARFTHLIRDGILCHRDKAELEPLVSEMVATGAALIGCRSIDRIKQ